MQSDRFYAENLDVERTDWTESLGEDFIMVHNPRFSYENNHPYKLRQTLAIIPDGGEARGTVNFKDYTLTKGCLFIVLSGSIMESYSVSEDFAGTYIFMSKDFLTGLEVSDGYNLYGSVERHPLSRLKDRILEAIHLYIDMTRAMLQVKENPNNPEGLRLLTKAFFLQLGWWLHGDDRAASPEGRASRVTSDFIDLVKRNYSEHRDVAFYAESMNISAKYLSSVVSEVSGKSPLQWIEDYVILDAKAQLSSSDCPVQQVAWNLHFPTQTFFGRYFRRAVGMSPSEYRSKVRGVVGRP